MAMDTIEILVRASGLHDAQRVEAMTRDLMSEIGKASSTLELADVARPSGDRLAAVLVLTGGVERDVLKLVAQLPPPALLIAHPAHNSLPAALEILARIRQGGGEGRILFGSPEQIAAGLEQELAITRAWERLRYSRVGLIGEPSDWLVASDVDRAFLKGRLSVELIPIEMSELLSRLETMEAPRVEGARFQRAAQATDRRAGQDVESSVRIYHALRAVIDEHRLAACSVRCFDLINELGQTGCYALSRLNDEKIPAGCEGDLQALFSLFVAHVLSGQPAFMGNVTSVAADAGLLEMAHCTCPLSMAAEYRIATHFESDLGVGIAAQLPIGPCTVFRLGGERLDRLFLREGTTQETPVRENLCRTQTRIAVDGPVGELLEAPLGNHHVLLAGHHRRTIEMFFNRYLNS